ncbi:MAG: transposase [Chloroflexi bacterium]|nr:transposase [Chloroflexota bacterium]
MAASAADEPMLYWGQCPDRKRLKWHCPRKAKKGKAQACDHECNCSQSPYGRVVYTYPKSNYRLFTTITRGGELWDKHYDHHSASERSHKRKKWDCGLRQTRTAGRERIFLRAMLMAMAQHLQAWAALSARQGQADQLDTAA